LQIATRMAIDLAGGEPSQIVRAGSPPAADKIVDYPPRRLPSSPGRRGGDRQAEILQAARLHGDTRRRRLAKSQCRHGVATWTATADIVEEVIRSRGSTSALHPAAARAGRGPADGDGGAARRARGPAHRCARGLNEAVTWSFVAEKRSRNRSAALTGLLANPISEEMKAMRPSLLPGCSPPHRAMRRAARIDPAVRDRRRYLADGSAPLWACPRRPARRSPLGGRRRGRVRRL